MAAEAAAIAHELTLSDEEQELRQCLIWIGFSAVQRQRICSEAFQTFPDLLTLSEKDIHNLEESFAKRTPAATRIIFGQRRTKYLVAFVHWVKDFRRIDIAPDIDGLDAGDFKMELLRSMRREEVRSAQKEQSESIMKEASPGMLKTEAKLGTGV